ncbi:hypothetical protein FHX37_0051 [Haloactinospora alba]|uniref:Uncharacterized protein n=1 Tax=Haloactinospora alba TaxID=405555 RepID=A0A543NEM1_9ACTN|nr:DUF6177 family protein [Haloactinospora alba]TQN30190.1 hypothetical protein FHX37_0051 [Haloactinospora alba]
MTARHPAVDHSTTGALVALQERPVVWFSSWLADAVSASAANSQGLQVVTPAHSRVTFPLRTVLTKPGGRWVVRESDGSGHYDGLTGVPLVWDDDAGYVTAPEHRLPDSGKREGKAAAAPSPTFRAGASELGGHLLLDLRLLHPATEDLRLGGAAESLSRTFAGAAPAGWGTSEPALAVWDRDGLTALCRQRAPQPTWTVLVGPEGRPFLGTQRVSRVRSGVKESLTVMAARSAGEELPLGSLPEVVREFAGQGTLQSLTAYRLPGRPDGTYEPRAPSLPVPVGMAVGPEGVAEAGLAHALDAPSTGHRLGPSMFPAVWFPLGSGTDPAAWRRLDELLRHFRPDGGQPA